MQNNNLTTVTIGIAAYNAERNIRSLLTSVCTQSGENFTLVQIAVYSDCSKDATVALAKTVGDSRVVVVDGNERVGFVGAVQYLLKASNSDLTILLNDDIVIEKNDFISQLVTGYRTSNAGLLCGNPQPMKSRNFIANAISSSFYAYYNAALHVNNGHNMYTYDGKVMGLSRQFRDSLQFPADLRLAGNVDSYIYFSCLSQGFNYYFVKEAVVLYKSPTNMKDYLRWFIRNNANHPIMKAQFGDLVDREEAKPRLIFAYYKLRELVKNPLGSLFIFILSIYIKIQSHSYAQHFQQTWEVVQSTKELG